MGWGENRRGAGENGRKRVGTSSVLYGTAVELVWPLRTQEEENKQKIQKAEKLNRTMEKTLV